jgi:ribosomal protein L32
MTGLLPDGCETVNEAIYWARDNYPDLRAEEKSREQIKQWGYKVMPYAFARRGYIALSTEVDRVNPRYVNSNIVCPNCGQKISEQVYFAAEYKFAKHEGEYRVWHKVCRKPE